MSILRGFMPPTRENYDIILTIWKWFPVAASLQWVVSWYGMGKTSVVSRLNVPGRIGWMVMESPGFLTLLYIMKTLPAQHGIADLPWQNKVLAALYVIHYSYRAVLYPWIQPSMSPLHVLIVLFASAFQLVNATCLGAWLAAYGPTTQQEWATQLGPYPTLQFTAGISIFYIGLAANYYHDDELREIRRREMARQARLAREQGSAAKIDKHYEIPQAGLFQIMLYPHYFVEWVEWFGFYLASGWSCLPARLFLLNEITAMLPRAVRGKRWYVERFGEEKIKNKWAVIPGVW